MSSKSKPFRAGRNGRSSTTQGAPDSQNPHKTEGPPAPSAPRRFGPGHGLGPNRSKIRELLTEQDLRELDALIESPGQTIETVTAWVHARGYTSIGASAVGKYVRDFRRRLAEVKRAAEISHAFAMKARHSGLTLSDGMVGAMQQILMEHLVNTHEAMNITTRDLPHLVHAVTNAVRTAGHARDPGGGAHSALVERRPAKAVASRVIEPAPDRGDRRLTVAERDAALESVVDRVNDYLLSLEEPTAADQAALPEPTTPPDVPHPTELPPPPASAPPLPPGEGRGEGERQEPSLLEGPEPGTAESAEGNAEESPQMDADSHR